MIEPRVLGTLVDHYDSVYPLRWSTGRICSIIAICVGSQMLQHHITLSKGLSMSSSFPFHTFDLIYHFFSRCTMIAFHWMWLNHLNWLSLITNQYYTWALTIEFIVLLFSLVFNRPSEFLISTIPISTSMLSSWNVAFNFLWYLLSLKTTEVPYHFIQPNKILSVNIILQ